MASVQQGIVRAARHLSEMTLSQRLAVGLGALLVVSSLVWLGLWAARPEMVPLLDQHLEPEDLALVRSGLEALGEPYRISGTQVLVPASANRQAILAALQQAEKLPADTSIGFAQLVKEANPWISAQENDRRWTVALQSELARVLRQFNGVKHATVLLNLNARPRGFARTQPEATASVTLFTRGGEPVSRSLALAAARMVAGAVRGLPVRNVEVLDGENGRVALDWDSEEEGTASALHRLRRQLEREKELQIKEQLGFDRNALVSVSCELDHASLHVQDSLPSEGVLVREESESTATVRSRRSGQPGVQPNVAVEAATGSGADTTTQERRQSEFTPGMKTSTQDIPAGSIKRITAAVSLSYSYLASVYRLNNAEAETPTEQQIEQVFARQKEQIAAHVARLLVPPEPSQVSVTWHYDVLEPPAAVGSDVLDTSLELARRYGPVSGLALLALLALGMTMRLARQQDRGEAFGLELGLPAEAIAAAKRAAESVQKVAGRPAVATAAVAGASGETAGAEARPAAPIPVGEAVEGVLEAQEVDETTVKTAHMIEQVAKMAQQDVDTLAAIVDKWVDQAR